MYVLSEERGHTFSRIRGTLSESGDATISFDMINIQTYVLIQTPIRKLEIRRGVMELCSNIFTTNRGILITVNGQECVSMSPHINKLCVHPNESVFPPKKNVQIISFLFLYL